MGTTGVPTTAWEKGLRSVIQIAVAAVPGLAVAVATGWARGWRPPARGAPAPVEALAGRGTLGLGGPGPCRPQVVEGPAPGAVGGAQRWSGPAGGEQLGR